jgi:hypothetical protein
MGKGGKGLASSLSTEPDDDEYFGDLLKKFRKNCPDCKSSDTKVLNALKKKLADWDHEIAVPNSFFGQVAKALAPSPKTSAGNTAAKTAKQPNKPKSVPKRSATKKTIVANTQVDSSSQSPSPSSSPPSPPPTENKARARASSKFVMPSSCPAYQCNYAGQHMRQHIARKHCDRIDVFQYCLFKTNSAGCMKCRKVASNYSTVEGCSHAPQFKFRVHQADDPEPSQPILTPDNDDLPRQQEFVQRLPLAQDLPSFQEFYEATKFLPNTPLDLPYPVIDRMRPALEGILQDLVPAQDKDIFSFSADSRPLLVDAAKKYYMFWKMITVVRGGSQRTSQMHHRLSLWEGGRFQDILEELAELNARFARLPLRRARPLLSNKDRIAQLFQLRQPAQVVRALKPKAFAGEGDLSPDEIDETFPNSAFQDDLSKFNEESWADKLPIQPDPDLFHKFLMGRPNVKAPGLSGLRSDWLKRYFSDKYCATPAGSEALEKFATLAWAINYGYFDILDPEVAKWFRAGRVSFISKAPKPGFRPIQVFEVAIQLGAKWRRHQQYGIGQDQFDWSNLDTGPQLGVNTSSGAEQIILVARCVSALVKQDQDFVVLDLDAKSAFQMVNRYAVVQGLLELGQLHDARAAYYQLRSPSLAVCYWGSTKSYTNGFGQGLASSSTNYAAASYWNQKQRFAYVKEKHGVDLELINMNYADDNSAGGNLKDLLFYLDSGFKREALDGIYVRLDKSTFFSADPQRSRALAEKIVNQYKLDARVLGLEFRSITDRVVMNVPVADSGKEWQALAQLVQNAHEDLDRVASLQFPQAELYLLNTCVGTQLTMFAARTASLNSEVEQILVQHDRNMVDFLARMMKVPFKDLSPLQHALASLSIKKGGLGLHLMANHLDLARVASLHVAVEKTRALLSARLGLERTEELLRQYTDFYNDTRAKLQNEQVWVEDDKENPNTIYKKQHLMSQQREEKTLVPRINAEIGKLPEEVQKPTAYLFTARKAAPLDTTAWIQNFGDRFFLPNYRYNDNDDVLNGFALCIQKYLFLPFGPDETQCPLVTKDKNPEKRCCKKELGSGWQHVLSVAHGGDLHRRAEVQVQCLQSFFTQAGIVTTPQEKVPGSNARPGDLAFNRYDGNVRRILLDGTTTLSDTRSRTWRKDPFPPGWFAFQAEKSKYADLFAKELIDAVPEFPIEFGQPGFNEQVDKLWNNPLRFKDLQSYFWPAAVEIGGPVGPHQLALLSFLANKIATEKRMSSGRLLNQMRRTLSKVLMDDVARTLLITSQALGHAADWTG